MNVDQMAGSFVQSTKSSLDGFPRQFVSSLKVLFDILDEEGTGFVRLTDIENRWNDNRVIGLPAGVLAALRKSTPSNGKLSFERFVDGLQIALLHSKIKAGADTIGIGSNNKSNNGQVQGQATGNKIKLSNYADSNSSPSVQQNQNSATTNLNLPQELSNDCPKSNLSRTDGSTMSMAIPTLNSKSDIILRQHVEHKGNNFHLQQRPRSVSTMSAMVGKSTDAHKEYVVAECDNVIPQHRTYSMPQLADTLVDTKEGARKWKSRSIASSQQVAQTNEAVTSWQKKQTEGRRSGDGHPAVSSTSSLGQQEIGVAREVSELTSKVNRRVIRRDSRRHTVSSGVDFNMVKRMKQLEIEGDVLLQGSTCVQRACTWYQQQLQAVQQRQADMRHTTTHHYDHNIEAHQERLNFQTARILEVNQQLKALIDSSEKGFPLHMNLAVNRSLPQRSGGTASTADHQATALVAQLRSENMRLVQERDMKSERIIQLENEKAQQHDEKCARINQLEVEKSQVIRELFGALSKNRKHKTNYDDTTFI